MVKAYDNHKIRDFIIIIIRVYGDPVCRSTAVLRTEVLYLVTIIRKSSNRYPVRDNPAKNIRPCEPYFYMLSHIIIPVAAIYFISCPPSGFGPTIVCKCIPQGIEYIIMVKQKQIFRPAIV